MVVINPKISVSMDPTMFGTLNHLARKERKTVSAKAYELLALALDMENAQQSPTGRHYEPQEEFKVIGNE